MVGKWKIQKHTSYGRFQDRDSSNARVQPNVKSYSWEDMQMALTSDQDSSFIPGQTSWLQLNEDSSYALNDYGMLGIAPQGTYYYGPLKGRWSITENTIILKRREGFSIPYRVQFLSEDSMVLEAYQNLPLTQPEKLVETILVRLKD
jgi:hypothetical protein